jgi:alkylation response protein AidB-like acyl-CoA dehydrogenase
MDLTLNDEHAELRATVEKFAQAVVAPVAGELYERGEFPYEIVRRMGGMGLFGLPIAEEHGGMGGDYFALCLAIEELARVDSSVAITLEAAVSLGAMPLARFGTPAQQTRWLPGLAAGEALGAFGLTEPGGGSDAAATRTTARLDGDEWVINGAKSFITNSGTTITTLITVTAVTGERDGRKEISTIIVPAGTPGLTVSAKYSKVGWASSDTRGLFFDDVRVPAENLLGEENKGLAVALTTLERTRLGAAAQAVGIAQGATDYAVSYAKERIQFGKPIFSFQAIQHKLAEMETRTAAARELLYKASVKVDANDADKGKYSAMAKVFAGDTAMAVTVEAVQVLGGYGYVTEYPVERMMRDAKITQIYEGTQEVQRLVIARYL